MRSKKYQNGDCAKRWSSLRPTQLTIGSLFVLAKGGNLGVYERIRPTLKMPQKVFGDSASYLVSEINTMFLTPKNPEDHANTDQVKFHALTSEFLESPE